MAALADGVSKAVESVRGWEEELVKNRYDSVPYNRDIQQTYARSEDWEGEPEDKVAARFLTGRGLGNKHGVLGATVRNLGYEGMKGLSMALGLDRVLGAPRNERRGSALYDIDETTSPASWSNALAAQAGIMSDFFYPGELPKREAEPKKDGFESGTLGDAMTGRSGREEKLRALAGDKYGAVVISEMGGPKKDRKKELNDQIRGKIEDGSLDDVFRKNILGSYQQGSLGGEDDLLGELVRRQQAAAMMGGQAPPDQGPLPPGTGPMASPGYGAPGQTAPPISPEQAQEGPGMMDAIYRMLGMGGSSEKKKGFEDGSLKEAIPAYARSLTMESSRAGIPSWAHRKVMNSIPTLAGLGIGLSRGAEFGPGPADSIVAQYDDPSGLVDPQALGEVMMIPKRLNDPGGTTQTHELGHVAQGKYLGPLLPAAAALTSAGLAMGGKDSYMDSPFETSALAMGEAEKSRGSTSQPILEAFRQLFAGKYAAEGGREPAGPPKHLAGQLVEGLLEQGNIDLYDRPDVNGSTVRSMSFEDDGREILIPTVVGDRIVSDDEAIEEYRRTGKHMGVFDSPEHATAYASAVHDDYESGRIPTKKR